MQLRPKSPQVLLNHGLVLNAMNRHQEALASFDEALKHKGRFAEALNNRGSVLVTLGRSAEALDNFKRAIAIKPDYADAFYNQGNALKELDRYDEALKSYDRAIALRPNYAKAHCNRGSVLDMLGRPADALVVLRPGAGDRTRLRRSDAQPLRRAARAQAHRRNAARPRPAADACIRTTPRRTTCAAC